MLELWLVRHGVTDWNLAERIQGSSDPPLNAAGRAQAERLAPRLAGVVFDRVVSSDLDRARTTAALALPGAEVRLDPRLRELNYGAFEGATWADLATGERAAAAAHWRADRRRRRIPGGESFDDLAARVGAFQADLPATGRVIAFAHSGTINTALHGVLGHPEGRGWRFEIANTGITVLRIEARRTTIVTVNDHAHLRAG
ncbi:MAG: histidine phosphatase family protein [Trueperaceae bacterium]